MRFLRELDEIRRFGLPPAAVGLLLAVTGLAVWSALSVWGGAATPENSYELRDAFNASAYLYVGMPLMALAVGLAAYHIPEHSWRWPLCLVGGHQAGVLLIGLGMQSGLSLVILALLLAVLLAALFAVPALVGSTVARHRAARSY